MQKQQQKIKKMPKFINNQFDFILCITILLLLSLGIIMVLSASAPSALAETKSSYTYVSKQAAFAIIGIILMFIISKIDYRILLDSIFCIVDNVIISCCTRYRTKRKWCN